MNLMNLHWHIITIPCPLLTLAFTLGVVPSMSLGKCMLMCIHCYSILQSIFTFQKILCVLPMYPFPQSLTTTDLFTAFITLPFPECSVVGIIQYVEFSNWLLSLSDMPVFSRLDGSFPFSTEIVLHCLDVPQFIQLPMKDVLVSFFWWEVRSPIYCFFTCMQCSPFLRLIPGFSLHPWFSRVFPSHLEDYIEMLQD